MFLDRVAGLRPLFSPTLPFRRVAMAGLVLCLLVTGAPIGVALGDDDPPAPKDQERFFGAVQAIFNPRRSEEAGVQWERLIFPWSMIQPDGPGSWSDGYFTDQQIAREIDRGIDVVGIAIYTPHWA